MAAAGNASVVDIAFCDMPKGEMDSGEGAKVYEELFVDDIDPNLELAFSLGKLADNPTGKYLDYVHYWHNHLHHAFINYAPCFCMKEPLRKRIWQPRSCTAGRQASLPTCH